MYDFYSAPREFDVTMGSQGKLQVYITDVLTKDREGTSWRNCGVVSHNLAIYPVYWNILRSVLGNPYLKNVLL